MAESCIPSTTLSGIISTLSISVYVNTWFYFYFSDFYYNVQNKVIIPMYVLLYFELKNDMFFVCVPF